MASTVRPLSKKEIRRENEKIILDAAEKVFAEAGFGGATMQLIADVAGLPKANLHYYFPTKESLYRQVVENIFTIWLEAADVFEDASGNIQLESGWRRLTAYRQLLDETGDERFRTIRAIGPQSSPPASTNATTPAPRTT